MWVADNKMTILALFEYYWIARAPFLALCEKWVITREKKLRKLFCYFEFSLYICTVINCEKVWQVENR